MSLCERSGTVAERAEITWAERWAGVEKVAERWAEITEMGFNAEPQNSPLQCFVHHTAVCSSFRWNLTKVQWDRPGAEAASADVRSRLFVPAALRQHIDVSVCRALSPGESTLLAFNDFSSYTWWPPTCGLEKLVLKGVIRPYSQCRRPCVTLNTYNSVINLRCLKRKTVFTQ